MHWYFKRASDEEREHAMKLLKYLNKRGGKIILQDIKNPDTQGEMTAVEAMTKALELEKEVNEVRLNLFFIFQVFKRFLFFSNQLKSLPFFPRVSSMFTRSRHRTTTPTCATS